MDTSLHKSDLFKGLTDQQYTDLLKSGRNTTLQSKDILFRQGDSAISCALVNRGRLKLTKLNEQGKEVILRSTHRPLPAALDAACRRENPGRDPDRYPPQSPEHR